MKKTRFKSKIYSAIFCASLLVVSMCGFFFKDVNTTTAAVGTPNKAMRFIQVAGGVEHTVALTADGDVYGWGSNGYNQLGLGTDNNSVIVQAQTPRLIFSKDLLSVDKVIKVAASEYTTALLTTNGQVYFAGHNSYGQFGAMTVANTYEIHDDSNNNRWANFNKNVLSTTGAIDPNNNALFSNIEAGAHNFVMQISSGKAFGTDIPPNSIFTTGPKTFNLGGGNQTNPVLDNSVSYIMYLDIAKSELTSDLMPATATSELYDWTTDTFTTTALADSIVVGGGTMYYTSGNNIYAKGKNYFVNNRLVVKNTLNVANGVQETSFQSASGTADTGLYAASGTAMVDITNTNSSFTTTKENYTIKDSDSNVVYTTVSAVSAAPFVSASDNFGYAVNKSGKGYHGWGNNTTGQLKPKEPDAIYNGAISTVDLSSELLGATIDKIVAGKVKHVNYAEPTDTGSERWTRAQARTIATISTEESNQEYISAVLASDGKVFVWGNITGGIQPSDGYVQLADIEGNPKIVSIFQGYKSVYLISEHGKLYEYKGEMNGSVAAQVKVKKQFLDAAGKEVVDLSATPIKTYTFAKAGDTASINLLNGIKNTTIGGSDGNDKTGALFASAQNNAARFMIPAGTVDVISNNLPANPSGLTNDLNVSSEKRISASQYLNSDPINFYLKTSAGQSGNGTPIDDTIGNYLVYNFSFEDDVSANQNGRTVQLNLKALKRTTGNEVIAIHFTIGAYDAYDRETATNNIIYSKQEIIVYIQIADNAAQLQSPSGFGSTGNTIVVDANKTENSEYSIPVMNIASGFSYLNSYYGIGLGSIESQLAIVDKGYSVSRYQNFLAKDLDGDRLTFNATFFDGDFLNTAFYNNTGYYTVSKKVITITVSAAAAPSELDKNLFKNYFGFYNMSWNSNEFTFSYDILSIKAIQSTSSTADNVFFDFSVGLQDGVSGATLAYSVSANNAISAKVDSTVFFKDNTIQNTKKVTLGDLYQYASIEIPLATYLNDTSLVKFSTVSGATSNPSQITAFKNTFDPEQIVVSDFREDKIVLTANGSSGLVSFSLFVFKATTLNPETVRLDFTINLRAINEVGNQFKRKDFAIPIVYDTREISIGDLFSGYQEDPYENGYLIEVIGTSIPEEAESILRVDILDKIPNQVQKLRLVARGAGQVILSVSAREKDVILTASFVVSVSGTANFSEVINLNGAKYNSLDDLKQAIIADNNLDPKLVNFDTPTYKIYSVDALGNETELSDDQANALLTIIVSGDLIYYNAGRNLTKDSPNKTVNVIFSFIDKNNNTRVYSIRQTINLVQISIFPEKTNDAHRMFFINSNTASEFLINAQDIAKFSLSDYNEQKNALYGLSFAYFEPDESGIVIANVELNAQKTALKLTPQQSGTQTVIAMLTERVGSNSYNFYTIYFDVEVEGITTVLPRETYLNFLMFGSIGVFLFLFIIFMIRMSIYWRKKAQQRKIIKRNQELVKMRERLHGRVDAVSKDKIVRTKLKMEDPKYAKMFTQMKNEKTHASDMLVEGGGIVDDEGTVIGGKKKKGKNTKNMSIEDRKAELEAKRAQLAQMQQAGNMGFDSGVPLDDINFDDMTFVKNMDSDGYQDDMSRENIEQQIKAKLAEEDSPIIFDIANTETEDDKKKKKKK